MESISVKNYRSIVDSGEIEIKPLTVIVGKNSAGKSSFVRLLPLLKQTLERKTSDSLLWYGDYVDFGDFEHAVCRDNKNEPIVLSFKVLLKNGLTPLYVRRKSNAWEHEQEVSVTLYFREKYIEKIVIDINDQNVTVIVDEKQNSKVRINDDYRPFENKKMITVRGTGDIIPSIIEEKEDMRMYYGFGVDTSEIADYVIHYIFDSRVGRRNTHGIRYEEVMGIDVSSKEKVLEELRQINPKRFQRMQLKHKRFQKINNCLIALKLTRIIDRINKTVNEDMRHTNYLKPIRAMVDRYYRVQGISISELDSNGSNLPMILVNMSKRDLATFESWSKDKFGVIFSVKQSVGHLSLVIKNDLKGEKFTNVADTGYGYSQMLPIVMLLWMMHRKIIDYKDVYLDYYWSQTVVIEQPELHLHPAYQAKMIDVFANVINEAKKNGITMKIIFETHSETMVNRVGTLISEKVIDEKDVNILVFDKVGDNTRITSKRFDDEGMLIGWPIGFFSSLEV